MSEKKNKTDKGNKYLTQYNAAEANLTSLLNEINMLNDNPQKRMSEQTYKNKLYAMALKWNKILGHQKENEKSPRFNIEYLVKDLEKQKADNRKVLSSFYKLKPGSNFANFIGQTGLGITGGGGGINFATKTPGYVNLPAYSSEGGINYQKNEYYVDRFNPKGETAFQINKDTPPSDDWTRNYDHPNYGINPKSKLTINGNTNKVDKSTLTISNGQ